MKEDILNGNYNDPMVLDSYAISRIDGFGENVEKLSKALKESNVKYMKKRKDAQEELDEDEFEGQYPKKRNYRPVEGVQEPWTGDQSFIWPDYEAEAFEKELESFRARPESNTGYNNKALNKKMTDKHGDRAKKCINNTLFKESRTRKSLKEGQRSAPIMKQFKKGFDVLDKALATIPYIYKALTEFRFKVGSEDFNGDYIIEIGFDKNVVDIQNVWKRLSGDKDKLNWTSNCNREKAVAEIINGTLEYDAVYLMDSPVGVALYITNATPVKDYLQESSRSLQEAENTEKLLKQYEEDNHWNFIQSEDFEDLKKIVEALRKTGAVYFDKYGYEVTDKYYNNNDPKSLYIKVEGFGRRNAVTDYRISFVSNNAKDYNFLKDWCKVNHLGQDSTYRNRIAKQIQKLFKTPIENTCELLGFEIEDISFERCESYDSNYYVYIDLKPVKRLNALNSAPADKRLQRLLDLIVADTEAELLTEFEGKKYWKFTGYEGAEVIFTTCLTVDKSEVYPSDDEAGYSENPNFSKPILYLDIPNTGYCNWNSGTGYITDRHVKSIDAIEETASRFIKRLKEVSREVYSNSNY